MPECASAGGGSAVRGLFSSRQQVHAAMCGGNASCRWNEGHVTTPVRGCLSCVAHTWKCESRRHRMAEGQLRRVRCGQYSPTTRRNVQEAEKDGLGRARRLFRGSSSSLDAWTISHGCRSGGCGVGPCCEPKRASSHNFGVHNFGGRSDLVQSAVVCRHLCHIQPRRDLRRRE